jgi:hypothetical protein
VIPDVRGAYAEAAGWFVGLVRRIDGDWDAPALGSWTRRDLVGHTSRALLTVESYLRDGPVQVEAASAVDYFVRTRATLADPEQVAARGRAAGEALGGDPAAAVAGIAERVLPLVAAAGVDAYVETPVAAMRLDDYLPTRTFELVVHGCDLAVACRLDADVPVTAAAEAGAVLVALAAHDGTAADLLLSATGRRTLPAGFTVL